MSPFSTCCLLITILLSLAATSPAAASISVSAVASPPPRELSTPQQFLLAHNEARAAVGVPPLSWNLTLMTDALRYSTELRERCSSLPLDPPWPTDGVYGRNLYKGRGFRNGTEAAAYWLEGRRWYESGKCAASAPRGRCCGAYTQMVWRDTTQVGCVRRPCRCLIRPCSNVIDTVAVCEYYPPGNQPGQRPY
uniref:SCP domain-containing protein n=1 Tax=Leersia perrieri TaxID=77586 RepID=A0A0D9W381_9ORYZ